MDSNPMPRPPSYDKKIGLVLQGGGALGSYQAGVYEALASSEYLPDWVAGISIGAINAAIIAGNPPEARVEKLLRFWEAVTQPIVQWQAPFAWPGAALPAGTSAAPSTPDFWTRRRSGAGAEGRHRARLFQSMGGRPRAL